MGVDRILKKEVMPPRPAPTHSCNVVDVIEEDKRIRASFARAIWMMFLIVALAEVFMRLTELSSW